MKITDTELQKRFDKAVAAAKAAGQLITQARQNIQVSRKGLNDFVTQADKDSEQCIKNLLLGAFPDDSFFGEETGLAVADEKKHGGTWIVDPIDGTTNYIHGLPLYCISIAYEKEKGVPVLGVVYIPASGELFTAVKGCGAELNGEKIRVSDCSEPRDAFVIVSEPSQAQEVAPDYLEKVKTVFYQVCALRNLGSAATELCFIACGRCDAYFEYRLKYYDIAAGKIILEEAGGKVSQKGSYAAFDVFLATNGALHSWFENELGNPFHL